MRAVVEDGRRAVDAGAAGHVFNLGHGVLPGTDPGGDHRRRGIGAFAVNASYCRCRRRDFGSGRGLPAAGRCRAGRDDHGVRPGRPARRRAAHRADRRPAAGRRRGGVRRAPAGGARAAGRAGLGGQADRHHRRAAADLQPAPAAPAARRTPCRASRRNRRRWPGWSTTPRSRGCATSAPARSPGGPAPTRRSPNWSVTGSASRWWPARWIRCWRACTPGRRPRSACGRPLRRWRRRWTAGARSLTDAVREALPPTAGRIGVRRRRRRLRGAGRRARPPGRASAGRRWPSSRSTARSGAGSWSTTRGSAGTPTRWCWPSRRRGCRR